MTTLRLPSVLASIFVLAGCASTNPNSDSAIASTSGPGIGALPISSSPFIARSPASGSGVSLTGSTTANAVFQVAEPGTTHVVDLTIHANDLWERIRMGFAIPDLSSPVVVEQQAWYLSHPEFLQRASERSSRYLYHIVEELQARGLPTELALLPFVESAYNPMAYSRAQAAGMWQFIPATGKLFNLRQDWWHDERRDVVASTDAALNYLQQLYETYGDWTLALAAYNWGEGSVRRALDKNRAHGLPLDYMSLNMPDETRNYFPRLQALKNIIAHPEAFGITLPHIDNERYFVSIPKTRDVDVKTAARMADMPVDEFQALNPAFSRPVILGDSGTMILVPADRAAAFQERLASADGTIVTWQAYTVRKGERLDHIAAHFGMTMAALCEANGVSARTRLKPGMALLVRRSVATPRVTEPDHPQIIEAAFTVPATPVMGTSARRVVVGKNETLYAIAKRTGTTVQNLMQANQLKTSIVHVGQTLTVPAVEPVRIAAARTVR